CIALATLVFGWAHLWGELKGAFGDPHPHSPWWPALLGHLAALSVFAWLTALVLERGIGSSPYADTWTVAWARAGVVSVALWSAAALPFALWLLLARRGLVALSVGVVVGTAVWAAGLWANSLWQPLGRWTLWVVAQLLGLLTADVVCQASDL